MLQTFLGLGMGMGGGMWGLMLTVNGHVNFNHVLQTYGYGWGDVNVHVVNCQL